MGVSGDHKTIHGNGFGVYSPNILHDSHGIDTVVESAEPDDDSEKAGGEARRKGFIRPGYET